MAKPILRVGKMKSSGRSSAEAVDGHLLRSRPTPNCDPSRTHLNQRIMGDNIPLADAIDRVMSRAGLDPAKRRSDATIANDIVMTVSPEWFRPNDPNASGTWDDDRLRAFTAEAEQFARKTWGATRIASMVLHLDEATPHVHIVVVPIMPGKLSADGKKTWRLSGKDMFGPEALQGLQQGWENQMLRHGVGKRLKGSTARHTTLREYYGSLEETQKIDYRETLSIKTNPPKKALFESNEKHQERMADWKKAEEKRMRQELAPLAREAAMGRLYESERLAGQALRTVVVDQTGALIDRSRLIQTTMEERDVSREEVARLRAVPLNEVALALGFIGEIGPRENAIDLVKRAEQMDFKTAVVWLAQRFGPEAASNAVREEALPKLHAAAQAAPVYLKAEATKRKIVQKQLQALSAPAYRVTIMDHRRGKDIGQNAGKDYLGKDLLTPQEVLDFIPTLAQRNAAGGNVYLTPVEKDVHFALVDDLTASGLGELKKRGYAPAIVQETSPGSFQAVLKLTGDKEAANEFFKDLNRELGDSRITGLAHPFRMAGFENRKEKHQDPEGKFPWVRLSEAVNRLCARSIQVVAEYAKRMAITHTSSLDM